MSSNPLSHTAWCDHIMLGEYKSWSTLLCSFLQSLCYFCPLSPNTFLSILFLNTFTLCSSLNVRDQVSHPHRTGNITVLICFNFMISDLLAIYWFITNICVKLVMLLRFINYFSFFYINIKSLLFIKIYWFPMFCSLQLKSCRHWRKNSITIKIK